MCKSERARFSTGKARYEIVSSGQVRYKIVSSGKARYKIASSEKARYETVTGQLVESYKTVNKQIKNVSNVTISGQLGEN